MVVVIVGEVEAEALQPAVVVEEIDVVVAGVVVAALVVVVVVWELVVGRRGACAVLRCKHNVCRAVSRGQS